MTDEPVPVARCTKCGGPIMRWESYRVDVQYVGLRLVRFRVHLSCPGRHEAKRSATAEAR